MKVHVLYPLQTGPWGGGNQFLRALRDHLARAGRYADSADDADVILFNSHHELRRAARLKALHPDKVFVHRMDGILSTQRKDGLPTDLLIYEANRLLADGTVFQSKWSRDKACSIGMSNPPVQTVIPNAPDPAVFKPSADRSPHSPVRLISTSWSANQAKGFAYYEHLDRHLDFTRYSMTFVGNSPVRFRNIRQVPAVGSAELARMLGESDVFVTASADDACSNSLIEAVHCGLPVIALRSGGHPELVGPEGTTFDDEEGLLRAIDEVSSRLGALKSRAPHLPRIDEVGEAYLRFCLDVAEQARARRARGGRAWAAAARGAELMARLLVFRVESKVRWSLRRFA